MKAQSLIWKQPQGWTVPREELAKAQLVILFAARTDLEAGTCLEKLVRHFPNAEVVGCSTGGQIVNGDVTDHEPVALAMRFERTELNVVRESIADASQSFDVGSRLGGALAKPDLKSLLVISDGLSVNGSKLIEGMRAAVGKDVVVTGGLAGDGDAFSKTVVVGGGTLMSGQVAVVGFYGSSVVIGNGCHGGWNAFGPKRVITSSEGNVLKTLDNKPALQLYKKYLGEEAQGLPGTALLYPLMIMDPENHDRAIVRTVLGVDHEQNTMTFAGDIPTGWSAQLMRGHFDSLAEGAAHAAEAAAITGGDQESDVAAILTSCVGRRLLMGESIVEEVEAAANKLAPGTKYIGFYSYGEISPHSATGVCELHNQTMTVTTVSEAR